MSELRRTIRESAKRARLGQHATCAECGEHDIRCLQESQRVLCAECRLIEQGKPPAERHHPAGRHNDPFTVLIPANDHAVLSDLQHEWPRRTLRNSDGSPLLRISGELRGWLDVLRILIDRIAGWIPDALEHLDYALRQHVGERWWDTIGWDGRRP